MKYIIKPKIEEKDLPKEVNESLLKEGITRDELFDLIMQNDGVLQIGDNSYVLLFKVNDTNISDMPESLKSQLISEDKYDNSWICVYPNSVKSLPISYEGLPIYGSSEKWVTKWFKPTAREAFNDTLREFDLTTKYDLYKDPDKNFDYSIFSFDIYTDGMPSQQTVFVYKNHAESFGINEYREIKKYVQDKYDEETFNFEHSYYNITPYSSKKSLASFKKNSKLGGYYIPFDDYKTYLDAFISNYED